MIKYVEYVDLALFKADLYDAYELLTTHKWVGDVVDLYHSGIRVGHYTTTGDFPHIEGWLALPVEVMGDKDYDEGWDAGYAEGFEDAKKFFSREDY